MGRTSFLINLIAVSLCCFSAFLLFKKQQHIAVLEQGRENKLGQTSVIQNANSEAKSVQTKSHIKEKESATADKEKNTFFIDQDPIKQREANARISKQLGHSLKQIEALYAPLYNELGLSIDEKKELSRNLVEIEEFRAVALETLRNLESRRAAYDKEIQQILSPEKYKQYISAESERGPNAVLNDMLSSIKESRLPPLPESELKDIHNHLKDIRGGADFIGSFGPYGKLPTVAVGTKRIEEQLSNRISRLEGEKTYLVDAVQNPESSSFIEKYYNSRITFAEKQLTQAKELETELSAK